MLDEVAAAAGTTVLLIDRPDADAAQRALVERAAVRDPQAVVVNVGLPARHPLPLPTIEVGAASRLGAQVAREALLGRTAPREGRHRRLRRDPPMDADVLALVRRSLPKLSAAEARVAETILGDPTLVVDLAINDLAKLCRTSLSTVARFAQTLGYSGYRELRVAVARTVTLAQAQQARFGLDSTTIDPEDEPAAIAAKLAAWRSTRSRRRRGGSMRTASIASPGPWSPPGTSICSVRPPRR